ncbi:MAG: hypothetical protein UHW86_11885, partial [Spirochaetota bacterium]|nr:hypothetical protein [Spirochaetota bacterium]
MTEKSDKKKKIKKTWKISTTVARNYMKFCERMKKRLDAIYNSKAYSFLFRRRMSIKLKTIANSPNCFQIYIADSKRDEYTVTDELLT